MKTDKPLKIRAAGKYYQVGYYENGNWINVEHLGTAEKVVELIRLGKSQRTKGQDVLKTPA